MIERLGFSSSARKPYCLLYIHTAVIVLKFLQGAFAGILNGYLEGKTGSLSVFPDAGHKV